MIAPLPLLTPAPTPVRQAAQSAARARPRGGPLPLPPVVSRRTRATVYGLARVDDRGRIASGLLAAALGWTAGTRVGMRPSPGQLIVGKDTCGRLVLTRAGHLLLPARLRRNCGIESGDRVLLAAEPSDGTLVVYSPASLDAMLDALPATALRGAV